MAERAEAVRRERKAERLRRVLVYTSLIVGEGLVGSATGRLLTVSPSQVDWGILAAGLGLCSLTLLRALRHSRNSALGGDNNDLQGLGQLRGDYDAELETRATST